jgi:hypothetical protein
VCGDWTRAVSDTVTWRHGRDLGRRAAEATDQRGELARPGAQQWMKNGNSCVGPVESVITRRLSIDPWKMISATKMRSISAPLAIIFGVLTGVMHDRYAKDGCAVPCR